MYIFRSPLRKRPRNMENTDSDVEATFNRLQTPIYMKERLSNDEILSLLTDTESIEILKWIRYKTLT